MSSGGDNWGVKAGGFHLSVTHLRYPVELPHGEVGFHPAAPGSRFAALDVEVTSGSQEAQSLRALPMLRVLNEERRSLDFVTFDASLVTERKWTSGERRAGTIFVEVPAGTALRAVVFDPAETGIGETIVL